MTMMTAHTPSRLAETGLAARAKHAVLDLVEGLLTARRVSKNAAELRALSDYQLKDLGIARSDIDRVARYGR